MTDLNLYPSPEDTAKFGTLAHVAPAERARIMALPFGQTKRAVERLQTEVQEARRAEAARERREKAAINAIPGTQRRPMTDVERRQVEQLQRVSFPLQSKDPAFVRSMAAYPEISERQAAYIKLLAYKYRRQL
jgi:hypothetical protein